MNKLGNFIYDSESFEAKFRPREIKTYRLRNGGTYTGETLKNCNVREGKGVLVKYDGSIFEGYWISDKLQYQGRIIYANGDYY